MKYCNVRIYSVSESLLSIGVGDRDIDPRTYEERQQSVEKPTHDYLKSLYPDERERAAAWEQILPAICGNQDIFLEIGMIAGARLCYQLLLGNDGKG